VENYVLLYFRRSCGILRFTVFQKVVLNIMFYCISEGRVEYYVLLYFRRSCGILCFTVFQKVMWYINRFIVLVRIVLKTLRHLVQYGFSIQYKYGFSIQYRLVQYISILYIPLYNNLLIYNINN
jgi:hypothetical protein